MRSPGSERPESSVGRILETPPGFDAYIRGKPVSADSVPTEPGVRGTYACRGVGAEAFG